MTPGQEKHLAGIKESFLDAVDLKYRKGQAEHGGDLYDMTTFKLINEAINESIDQFVYLTTLKQKLLAEIEVRSR